MNRRIVLTYTLLLTLFGLAGPGVAPAEISVDARLSHHSFPQNRAAQLTITVTGASRTADIDLPEVENLRFHSRGQSSQINMVNGSFSSAISHNYLVQGLQPGSYTIPPITVRAAGETTSTKAVSFEVTATGQKASGEKDQEATLEDIAFITVSETGEHYPGELVPVTIRLYLRRDYKVDVSTLPVLTGDGVVMEQLSSSPQQTQEIYQGNSFHVIIWQTTLSGIKTGKHPLQLSLEASLLIPHQKRQRSPFPPFGGGFFDDSMFEDFFGNYERQPITIKSPEIPFTVIPLPEENRPAGFTGAIGDFTLSVSASPLDVEVGEPITLTATVSGRGNFGRVEAPLFPAGDSWKTYSPTIESGDGRKTFEQAVVIRDAKVNEIPPLSFSYFDPAKKEYITSSSGAIPLRVKSTGSPAIAPPATQQPLHRVEDAPGQDILAPLQGLAPQKLKIGNVQTDLLPLYQKQWFIACTIVLLLLSTFAIIIKARQRRFQNNPGLQLTKEKRAVLHRDLALVDQARSKREPAAFLFACRNAIQNQLSEVCGVEPSAISYSDINTKLAADSPLLKIFTLAEQGAYGGATLSGDDMGELFVQLKDELEALT